MRLTILFLLLISLLSHAQEVKVRGEFHADSIKIGIPFPYSLSATYPKDKNVVFPDSTYSFDPFEIDHKTYFPTRTTGGISYDSVVYFLTSFEIDTVQRLTLPVFIVNRADCTSVYARIDSVFLQQMVKQVSDSVSMDQLPLKTNTAYQAVSWLLNYPLLLIVIGVVIVAVVAVWLIFGKRIKKYFKLKKLKKSYHQFMNEFGNAISALENNYSNHEAESTLLMWKKYMEQLQSRPYTKYTTKEIFNMVRNEKLANALKQIDRTIYREGQKLEKAPLLELQQYTEKKFQDKLEEVRNG